MGQGTSPVHFAKGQLTKALEQVRLILYSL